MSYFRFLAQNAPWLTAAFLLTFSSSYGQTFFISLFAGQIREEFGLSHGQWGGIYTLGTMASAVVMVWAGMLADRFRVRTLGPMILVFLSLACLAMAAVPSGTWLIPVIFALRFFGQGMTGHIAMVGVARWFVATRGKAMTIASLGFAAGNAILPIVFVALLASWQWRSLWVLAAGLSLATIPVLLLLLRQERTPQHDAAISESLGMNNQHWTRNRMLRNPVFWLLVPTYLGPGAWGTALFFQQVHLTEVKGWALQDFVALFPLFTLASVFMNFATGWAIDRFGTNRLMPLYSVPWLVAFVILSGAQDLSQAALGMVVAGVGVGAGAVLPGAFLAEHYGTRHLGSIKSAAIALMVLGSAIGPGVSGWLIDQGVDFPEQMLGIAGYFLVTFILAVFAVRMARPSLATAKIDI